ncbi:MAG: hypothetical protein RRY20_09550, partial [Bilophila sp.]
MTQAAPIQRQTVQVPTTLPKTTAPVSSIPVAPVAPVAPVVTSKVSTLRWVKPSNGAVLQNFNLASNVKGIRYGGNVGD